MDEKISFSVLELERTKDRQEIQNAYRRLLVRVNPEDDPEGFKRLRQAYETALAYAERPEAEEKEPETPVEEWLARVKKVYASLSMRLNPDCWKKLLSEDICLDLDTGIEARDALLTYMMEKYRVKTDIWKLIDKTFHLQEEREELLEKFHPNFIEFVMHECNSDDNFPFAWLEGEDDADYDTFLSYYYELCRQNDAGEREEARNTLELMKHLPVKHPYLTLEEARCARLYEKPSEASRLAHEALEAQGEDLRILAYAGEIFWENKEKEACREICEKALRQFPTHYMANKYLAKYYLAEEDFEKAKEYCVEAFRVSTQEEELLHTMREINTKLIELYAKRMAEGTASELDIMELGWCYLQNEETAEGVNLLEGRQIGGTRKAEYYNLLSKCYFLENDFEKAAEAACASLPLIEEEARMREEEAAEEEKGKELEKVPGRIGGAWEIIAKSRHQQARQEGVSEEKSREYYEQAEEAIEKALEQEPENRNYRIEKAQILMERKAFERAADVCSEMLAADSRDFFAYTLRQECYYELKNGQGVVDDFYRAKDIFAGYPRIYELAAEVFLHYGQPEDAKGILKQAEEAKAESPKLDLLRLSIDREEAENEEEFQAVCRKAMELYKKFKETEEHVSKEDWAELAYQTARGYRGIGRQEEALKYIEEAVSLKEEAQYLWIRANTLTDLREYDRAMADYLFCEKAYGENELVYGNMARCYEFMGKREEALAYYEKVLKVNPEAERANSYIVDIYMEWLKKTGDLSYYGKALPFADRQLELTPCAYYYIERGLLHMEARVWDKAEEDFCRAMELEPDNVYAYNNLGCTYKLQEKWEAAVETLKKAAKLVKEKETLLPFGNLGNCYEQMMDYVKAAAWYRRGAALFPENRSIREDLLRVLKKMRRPEAALAMIRELYGESTPREKLEAAMVYTQMGQQDKALSLYKQLLKDRELQAEAYSHMGRIYLYYRKKPKKALEFSKKALEAAGKTHYNYDRYCRNIMECYYAMGKPEAGLPYQKLGLDWLEERYQGLEHYLKNYYYRKSHLYNMGAFYYYAGDLKKAREYFDEIAAAPRCRNCNDKECEDYWEAMGFLAEAAGDLEEALVCYEKACRESVGNDTSISRAADLTEQLRRRR